MRLLFIILALFTLQACKHPLALQGKGDIVERNLGVRGCSWEEFAEGNTRCADNAVVEDSYIVSYEAIPRQGWEFVGWEGTACGPSSVAPYCDYAVAQAWVDFTNMTWPGTGVPATLAVFQELDSDSDAMVDSIDSAPTTPSATDTVAGVSVFENTLFRNDFFAQGRKLELKAMTNVSGSINGATDTADLYVFVAPRAGRLSAVLSGLSGDLDMKFYNARAEFTRSSINSGLENETIVQTLVAGETYALEVLEFNGDSDYSLGIEFTGSGPVASVANVSGSYDVSFPFSASDCDDSGYMELSPDNAGFGVAQDGADIVLAFDDPADGPLLLSWEIVRGASIDSQGVFHFAVERRFDDARSDSPLYQWVTLTGQFGDNGFEGASYVRSYSMASGNVCDFTSSLSGARVAM